MGSLEVKGLSKSYGSGHVQVRALDDVSLSVSPGEMVAILGPSGSGKTTLISLIAGLLTPTAGEIVIDGVVVTHRSQREAARFRREHVGIVFQEHHLVGYLTALENLLLVPDLSRRPTAADRARAKSLLDELGLADRADHRPSALSGGERQRVAIARALMNEPDILLVDEPTASLDTERGLQVVGLLSDLVKHRDITCLMVTHDRRMAGYADRALSIVDGKLAG